jgi:hypothetical protein
MVQTASENVKSTTTDSPACAVAPEAAAASPPKTKHEIDHAATRPPVPPVQFHNLPEALKYYPNFVAWRRDWKDGTNGKPGKWDKVLYHLYEVGNPG